MEILLKILIIVLAVAGGGVWLAARWAVSAIWAVLPLVLHALGIFIFYQYKFGDIIVDMPRWMLLVSAGVICLGTIIVFIQEHRKHAAAKRACAQPRVEKDPKPEDEKSPFLR